VEFRVSNLVLNLTKYVLNPKIPVILDMILRCWKVIPDVCQEVRTLKIEALVDNYSLCIFRVVTGTI